MPTTYRLFSQVLLALLLASATAVAQADTHARIVETSPSDADVLGSREQFWVRIEYRTDEPVNLWARAYRNGVRIDEAMTNASTSHAGAGEALGWFALIEPGAVDEVRVMAGGGKPYREREVARRQVNLRWTGAPPAQRSRPAWVTELLQVEQARYHEAAARRAAEPVSAGEASLFSGFMLIIVALLLAGICIPIWSAWKWRGGWRVAAAIPAATMLIVVARIVIDTARDPTSHNLWPFEILQFGSGALLAVGVLRWLRRRLGRHP